VKDQHDQDDDWDPTGYYRRQQKKHAKETAVWLWMSLIVLLWTMAVGLVKYCDPIWAWLKSAI